VSGGSQMALRMALVYPDTFHAALLHSASDPIGTADPLECQALAKGGPA
jgi:poly(3-hydroxybutyrate) depolymerase